MKRPIRLEPGLGQESVWDYPRPPRLEIARPRAVIEFGGHTIVDTLHSYRVLETSHPPVFYFASRDVACQLEVSGRRSFCEWKGEADYLDVVSGDVVARRAAWTYPDPSPGFEDIAGYIAFYPSLMDACTLDGVRVKAQVGDFYGGWITPDVVGPFKGAEGTFGW